MTMVISFLSDLVIDEVYDAFEEISSFIVLGPKRHAFFSYYNFHDGKTYIFEKHKDYFEILDEDDQLGVHGKMTFQFIINAKDKLNDVKDIIKSHKEN